MRSLLTLALVLSFALSGPFPLAQQPKPSLAESTAKHFADLTLVDQNGRKVDLYRDVMKDHTVVVQTFYATCTGGCPVVLQTMKSLQSRLGNRMERDVRLVSITVDPASDTPAALKAFASTLGAKPGWLFLTGTQEQVTAARKKLRMYSENMAEHGQELMAGNNRTGLWKKIRGLSNAGEVGDLVMTVVDD